MNNLRLNFFLFSGLMLSANAEPIYRWHDAQGHVQFSESKPLQSTYEEVNQQALPLVHDMQSLVEPAKKITHKPTKSKTAKSNSAASHRRAAAHDKAIRRCNRYQEQLETIQQHLHAGYREPTGNRLRAKRSQLEERIRKEC